MFLLIEQSQEGKTNTITLPCRWKKPCETWQGWGAGWRSPEGRCSAPQHPLPGTRQLAAAARAATCPRSEIPLLPGEEKGQNIFQRTAANVNDKIMNLKSGTSAPEAGLGSPFSWCKMVNTLRVKDISQLVPNYSPLKC